MNELTEMDTEYVYRLLNLLTEFPLQQGELDEFTPVSYTHLKY